MLDAELIKSDAVRKKRGYHHGNLRPSIIGAVAQLIEERRSPAFQLKEVADLVGTSQAAIYKHFDSKQQLLVETALAGYELQIQLRDHALAMAGPSPLRKLLAIGYAYVRFSQLCSGYFLLMKTFEMDEILSSKRYQRERDRSLQLIRSLITECIETGRFVAVDLDLALTVLQGGVFGLAFISMSHEVEAIMRTLSEDETLPMRYLSLLVEGLLSEDGRREMREVGENPFR